MIEKPFNPFERARILSTDPEPRGPSGCPRSVHKVTTCHPFPFFHVGFVRIFHVGVVVLLGPGMPEERTLG